MKILHCPEDVGGNAWILSRAERKLGLDSDVMVHRKSGFGYPSDVDLQLDKNSLVRGVLKLLDFFLKAVSYYDVFHFNFGSSLLPLWHLPRFLELVDLPILKRLGKKIIVTYQGCDVRQKNFCTSNYAISACAQPDCYGGRCNLTTDESKRRRVIKFSRYAHKIYGISPDLLHFLPPHAQFLPVTPVDLSQWQPSRLRKNNRNLTLLHSPSNRGAKGTQYVLQAIKKLKGQYRNVEVVLVENIPHNEVKELYETADLAIDQLLIGWYGGFAVEMMALGKPVVCYIREEDLKFIPRQMKEELPIINANPSNIYEVLKGLIEDREKLNLIGEHSRAYVERWHDPMKIAKRMKEVYESLCAE